MLDGSEDQHALRSGCGAISIPPQAPAGRANSFLASAYIAIGRLLFGSDFIARQAEARDGADLPEVLPQSYAYRCAKRRTAGGADE